MRIRNLFDLGSEMREGKFLSGIGDKKISQIRNTGRYCYFNGWFLFWFLHTVPISSCTCVSAYPPAYVVWLQYWMDDVELCTAICI
jgi:hypothetical protein